MIFIQIIKFTNNLERDIPLRSDITWNLLYIDKLITYAVQYIQYGLSVIANSKQMIQAGYLRRQYMT